MSRGHVHKRLSGDVKIGLKDGQVCFFGYGVRGKEREEQEGDSGSVFRA